MNKRIIILVLLLLNVFFYSCSSKKSATNVNSQDVVIPVHSNHMHEDFDKDTKKKEKNVDLKRKHYQRQTESVQKEMKRNEKISMSNTPVRKKKSCNSKKKSSACGERVDSAVILDGVSDTRQ